MSTPRDFHTSTLLLSGKVLLAGGIGANNSTFLRSAELYNPLTNSFIPIGSMNISRYTHSATLLPNGKVLIAGGNDGITTGLTSAELYEPADLVEISWEEIGGASSFEILAISFDPIQVDSFVNLETSGYWENLTGSTNSSLKALIYLKIGDEWVLFAEDDSIRGPFGSTFDLDSFVFFDVDFSVGPLGGINFTNSMGGSGTYRGMTPGTTFTFRIQE